MTTTLLGSSCILTRRQGSCKFLNVLRCCFGVVQIWTRVERDGDEGGLEWRFDDKVHTGHNNIRSVL